MVISICHAQLCSRPLDMSRQSDQEVSHEATCLKPQGGCRRARVRPGAGSWVDIPSGEDPGASAASVQARSKSKTSKGGLGGMMSALGRKPKDSGDPVKDLIALGYHEDDCRVRLLRMPHVSTVFGTP